MHSHTTPDDSHQHLAVVEDPPVFSIRLAARPGLPCAVCWQPTGAGPVAYRGQEVICDRCLLEDCTELGLVLALIAMTRAYATTEGCEFEALGELITFAQIYERVAARSGPRRTIRFDQGVDDGTTGT